MKIRGYAEHTDSYINVYTPDGVYTLYKSGAIGITYFSNIIDDKIIYKMRDNAIENGAQLETFTIEEV